MFNILHQTSLYMLEKHPKCAEKLVPKTRVESLVYKERLMLIKSSTVLNMLNSLMILT